MALGRTQRMDPEAPGGSDCAASPASSAAVHARIAGQIPAFATICVFGYLVDAGITYFCAKYLGMSPELARPPGFIVATVVNFALNRAITFRHSRAPLIRAFARYCIVASASPAVHYPFFLACALLVPRSRNLGR